MPSVPPIEGSPKSPDPDKSGPKNDTPAPPAMSGGGGGGMTDFMALFTPEQRKKFMNILVQNIAREIDKSTKKAIEELRKEREEMQ